MDRLRKFLRLTWSDKALLLEATLLLAAVRIGLRVVPFGRLRHLLDRLSRPQRPTRDPRGVTRERTIWAVEAAGACFPSIGTCLTQAIAAYVLLGRMGHRSNLRIGVRRGPGRAFDAHAWLEQDGEILTGNFQRSRYTPMAPLQGLGPAAAPHVDGDNNGR
jgi:hypothetical protein